MANKDFDTVEGQLSTISWQLKRIADSLELLTRPKSTAKASTNLQNSKLRALLDKIGTDDD